MTNQNLPVNRIREFLTLHRQMEGGDRERIAQVDHHSGKGPARLNAGDLQFLLDCLDRIRNLAYRAIDMPEPMTEIFQIAAGMPLGMALPPAGRPRPVTVDPDGTVRPDLSGSDPFEGGGGTTRTRTCVHCWRRCGDAPGGAGVVNGLPVCSSPEGGRPDCYRQIIERGHTPRACDDCRTRPLDHITTARSRELRLNSDGMYEGVIRMNPGIRIGKSTSYPPPVKLSGPFPLELPVTHIKQVGSHLNLCPNRGVGAISPSQATCPECREIYAASGDDDRSRHAPDTI